jgi:hypothetical protein
MRTSNKILIAAFILILVSLVFYDLSLKASYVSGAYKNRYRQFISVDYKNFDKIDLSASTAVNIVLEQGPYSVRMEPMADRFVKLSQTNGTLHIDAAFRSNFENSSNDYVMIISCPNLVKINADARYLAGGRMITDTIASLDFKWRPTVIHGFKLDSLTIEENHAGAIMLSGNYIKSVKAVLGTGKGSGSNMVILNDNHFQNLQLNILNKSKLQLFNADIAHLNYHLADSAKLILSGSARDLITKK